MSRKTSKKERRRLILISVAIISVLTVLVNSVYSDWKQILNNRKQEVVLTNEYDYLLDNEEKLSAEITKLQDDEYLARYAKEKYLLSSKDDIILKMD